MCLNGADGLRMVLSANDPVTGRDGHRVQLGLIERLLPNVHPFVLIRQALAGAVAPGGRPEARCPRRRPRG